MTARETDPLWAEHVAEQNAEWWAGETTEVGIFDAGVTATMTSGLRADLSNDEYHAMTDWLSSSQLKAYLPEHFKPATGSTEALDFGTLVHTAVLEPDDLAGYVPLDAATIGVKADGTPAQSPTMTAAWKRAVAEVEADGKRVIDKADLDRALAMRDALYAHPEARRVLDALTAVEESAFWTDANGVRHKARFDGRGPGLIADVKTTSAKPGEKSLGYAVRDYGYHLSAAHYLAVAEGLGLDVREFVWLFVGKTPPYFVTVALASELTLATGHDLRDEAIRRATDPTADAYPGATGVIYL